MGQSGLEVCVGFPLTNFDQIGMESPVPTLVRSGMTGTEIVQYLWMRTNGIVANFERPTATGQSRSFALRLKSSIIESEL